LLAAATFDNFRFADKPKITVEDLGVVGSVGKLQSSRPTPAPIDKRIAGRQGFWRRMGGGVDAPASGSSSAAMSGSVCLTGENVKVVQELMRHASSRFTLDVYSQARREREETRPTTGCPDDPPRELR